MIQINYTTYDVRHDQDVINLREHCDIMLLAHKDCDEVLPPVSSTSASAGKRDKGKKLADAPTKHPFWYARVIGIYHAMVRHVGPSSRDERSKHMLVSLHVSSLLSPESKPKGAASAHRREAAPSPLPNIPNGTPSRIRPLLGIRRKKEAEEPPLRLHNLSQPCCTLEDRHKTSRRYVDVRSTT